MADTTPFATSADVSILLQRELTEAEVALAATLLVVASAKIRDRFTTIDDRIADGTVDETIVAHVAAEMVKRYLDARGPNDPIREEAGPFAETWGQGQGAALVLTDDDCALLAPTGPRRPRTINLGLGIPAP